MKKIFVGAIILLVIVASLGTIKYIDSRNTTIEEFVVACQSSGGELDNSINYNPECSCGTLFVDAHSVDFLDTVYFKYEYVGCN